MSEIAIVSARKSRLEMEVKRGNKNAKAALETAEHPNRFLSTVQIGITLIGILTGIFSGEKLTADIERYVLGFTLVAYYAHSIAVTIVVIIITFLSLVIGELVPKRIGLTNPEGIAMIVSRPMLVITTATSPFVWLLTTTSDFLIRLFRIKPSNDSKITEEEIKAIIQEGTEGGAIEEIEQDIVERVFKLGDRNVSSLMTHRSDAVLVKVDDSAENVKGIALRDMHSLYPVYEDSMDNIIGIVLLKDLFRHISDSDFNLRQYLRPPQYVLENKSAYSVLAQFKTSGIHYGIVMDEYGQMKGVITMRDVLEALVGDVSEFYGSEFSFVERGNESWLVDGQYPLAEFFHRLKIEEVDTEHHYHTLSGLILHELQHIPKTGEKLRWRNLELEVVDMDKARIDKILVTKT
jgi:putative hemolysin